MLQSIASTGSQAGLPAEQQQQEQIVFFRDICLRKMTLLSYGSYYILYFGFEKGVKAQLPPK